MIKHQKKTILVPVSAPQLIKKEPTTKVRKGVTEKHNEVTVIIAKYAMPLNNVFSNGSQALFPNMMRAAFKAAEGFQDIDFGFNRDPQTPAFIFTVKAKTERRGDDAPNQELANKIVIAKANAKAGIIAARILKAIQCYYKSEIEHLASLGNTLDNFIARELSYIQKV